MFANRRAAPSIPYEARAALNLLSAPVWLFNAAERRKVWANSAALQLWKARDLEELVLRESAVDMTPIVESSLDTYVPRLEREDRIVEEWTIFPEGNPIKIVCSSQLVLDDDGSTLLLVEVLPSAFDKERAASGRQAAAGAAPTVNLNRGQQLQELSRTLLSERAFTQALLDAENHLVLVLDQRGVAARANLALSELSGFAISEVIARPVWETILTGADVASVRGLLANDNLQESLPRTIESELVRKDGTRRLISWKLSLVKSGDTTSDYIICIGTDLTDQRGVEQRLQINDRLASIGTLAAGVAHGINNPLSYVIANLEYVRRNLTEPAVLNDAERRRELDDILADALDGAERVRRIVSDLGLFSSADEPRIDSVDLRAVIERALSIAENEIRHRAKIVRELAAIPPVLGTHVKLGQVVLNLLLNAAQAIETGDVEHNAVTVRTRLDEKGRPELQVTDTGCGIQPEHLSRIFDPFFTTKPVGIGTGLGLSIAHRIVSEFGGELSVTSDVGKGTTVTVALEAAPADILPSENASAPPRPPLAIGKERAKILIVDDEPGILRALQRILSRHEVTSALSGKEALEKIKAQGPFDVILCDVMMPELSGIDVYERVRAMGTGQESRIVFMTGGAFTGTATAFLHTVKNTTLPKPFRPDDVRWLIQNMTSLPPRS